MIIEKENFITPTILDTWNNPPKPTVITYVDYIWTNCPINERSYSGVYWNGWGKEKDVSVSGKTPIFVLLRDFEYAKYGFVILLRADSKVILISDHSHTVGNVHFRVLYRDN